VNIEETYELLEKSKDIFRQQGPFIGEYKEDKVVFVGDTHGAINVTEYVFRKFYDNVDLIVFLGDYVDREPQTGVENLSLILKKLIESDENKGKTKIVVLRGNHESPLTNFHYGFFEELKIKTEDAENAYEKFRDLFSYMPYSVLVNGYLCMHGGLPATLEGDRLGITTVEDIAKLKYPDINPDDPVGLQILWNDPRDGLLDIDFLPSIRGEGIYYFGERVTNEFLSYNNFKGIIRGHEAVDGFRTNMNGKVITVFSSVYHGQRSGILYHDYNNNKFVRIYIKMVNDQLIEEIV